MKKYCYTKGKIFDISEVSSGVDDIGFLRGYGVFEVLRTYSSKPFLLEGHLNRFEVSANFLGLNHLPSREEISKAMDELISKFSGKEISLRIVATGGQTSDGMTFDSSSPTFLIIAEEFIGPNDEVYEKGISLFPVEHKRIFPRAKTLNYIFPIKIKRDIEEKGFFDLLYTSNGKALESSTSNFFIIKGDVLITPKDDILMGLTREFVIDSVKDHFQVEERDIDFSEIGLADEAFITATNKEVIPVIMVGEEIIGTGFVGDKVKTIMNLFKNKVENHAN